ncbi:MAG TPA: hypothetical protein VN618_14195 [Solirubrobacteraceae bacterium]|nr:hypothetical protein [Solirubrobacteraceae bacterium]
MSRVRGVCVLLAALSALAAGAPGAAAATEQDAGIEAVTIETSAGPVTCGVDPANRIGPGAVTAVRHGRRELVTILATGAALCESSLGEVEISGSSLPWRLVLNGRKRKAALHGTPKLALQAQLVALPSVRCVYEAGHATASLIAEQPAAIAASVPRISLDGLVSSPLCPALGPLSFSLTIP